jgi:hypothetical protein
MVAEKNRCRGEINKDSKNEARVGILGEPMENGRKQFNPIEVFLREVKTQMIELDLFCFKGYIARPCECYLLYI